MGQKPFTQNDQANEITMATVGFLNFKQDLIDPRAVTDFDFASQGIHHGFRRQATGEMVFPLQQSFSKLRNRRETIAVRQLSGRVDGFHSEGFRCETNLRRLGLPISG